MSSDLQGREVRREITEGGSGVASLSHETPREAGQSRGLDARPPRSRPLAVPHRSALCLCDSFLVGKADGYKLAQVLRP